MNNPMKGLAGSVLFCFITGLSLSAQGELQSKFEVVQVSCESCDDGAINLLPGNSDQELSYLWSNGSTTEDISGLKPGTYYLQVTDSKGVTEDLAFQLNEFKDLNVGIETTDPSCQGYNDGVVELELSGWEGPYSIYLEGVSMGEMTTFTGLSAGTYEIMVEDRTGRAFGFETTLNDPEPLLVQCYTNFLDCLPNSGMVSVEATGGTGVYHYLWNDGVTGALRTDMAPGTYRVDVTDNNYCITTEVVNINEHAGSMQVRSTAVSATDEETPDGAVDLTIEGGEDPISFNWSNGYKGEDLFFALPGNYHVTIRDSAGCMIVMEVDIPVLFARNN